MNKSKRLKRAVVITGATGGLGSALCRVFANAGYFVIGIYNSNDAAGAALESELDGLSTKFIKQDLTVEGKWFEFEAAISNLDCDRLTLIANACAPLFPKSLQLVDWQEVESQLDVTVKGAFLSFKKVLPAMARSKNGIFVSILSTAVDPPAKGFAAYAMAKSALGSFTKSINAEFSQRGIRAFSFSPGFMETALTDAWSEHFKDLITKDEQIIAPEKYAEQILKLCLEEERSDALQNHSIFTA